MERAIKDLSQLADRKLFEEVATGIEHIAAGVSQLREAACSLSHSGKEYPAKLMGNLAEEEAAKMLILLDAIRCSPKHGMERSRVLSYFYSHLAKGIYVEACNAGGIVTFGELARYIEAARAEYYLDGPNDIDWIFPNHITQGREDDLYVNYVREDGDSRLHFWTSPSKNAQLSAFPYHRLPSTITKVAKAVSEVGLATPDGLEVLAKIWRPISMTSEFHVDDLRELNYATLEALDARGVAGSVSDDAAATVVRNWLFPLYDFDLSVRKVDKKELQEIQRNSSLYGW